MIYFTFFIAILMVVAGINHFINPKFYNRFIPDPFPKKLSNYLAGIVEVVIGGFLFIEDFRSMASLCFAILMVLFLPLHVIDLLKEKPAIGSKKIATIRLVIQFLLIYYGWWVYISY